MNGNGMQVQISKDDFTKQDPADRDWLLFCGITNINKNGCAFGQKYHREEKHTKWKLIGTGFAVAIPVVYILAKIFVPGCP